MLCNRGTTERWCRVEGSDKVDGEWRRGIVNVECQCLYMAKTLAWPPLNQKYTVACRQVRFESRV